MIVRIAIQGRGHDEPCLLGYVEPPADGFSTYRGFEFVGFDAAKGLKADVNTALDQLYEDWHETYPEPDTDAEFVSWLVEKHGWTLTDHKIVEHTI